MKTAPVQARKKPGNARGHTVPRAPGVPPPPSGWKQHLAEQVRAHQHSIDERIVKALA